MILLCGPPWLYFPLPASRLCVGRVLCCSSASTNERTADLQTTYCLQFRRAPGQEAMETSIVTVWAGPGVIYSKQLYRKAINRLGLCMPAFIFHAYS